MTNDDLRATYQNNNFTAIISIQYITKYVYLNYIHISYLKLKFIIKN